MGKLSSPQSTFAAVTTSAGNPDIHGRIPRLFDILAARSNTTTYFCSASNQSTGKKHPTSASKTSTDKTAHRILVRHTKKREKGTLPLNTTSETWLQQSSSTVSANRACCQHPALRSEQAFGLADPRLSPLDRRRSSGTDCSEAFVNTLQWTGHTAKAATNSPSKKRLTDGALPRRGAGCCVHALRPIVKSNQQHHPVALKQLLIDLPKQGQCPSFSLQQSCPSRPARFIET